MTVREKKVEVARKMAKQHLRIDPAVKKVVLLTSKQDISEEEPITLLEVVEGTIERGIEPVYFLKDAKRGWNYPSVIVEVSPREYEGLRRKRNIRFQQKNWSFGEELAAR